MSDQNPAFGDQSFAAVHAKQELEQIKVERARIQDERDKRVQASSDADELAEARLALANDTAIEKAEAEHGPLGKGKISAVFTREGVVIVKKPNHIIFKKFQDTGEFTTDAYDKLVRSCLVHPDKFSFGRYVEEQPAILTLLADAVCLLAGVKMKEAAVK